MTRLDLLEAVAVSNVSAAATAKKLATELEAFTRTFAALCVLPEVERLDHPTVDATGEHLRVIGEELRTLHAQLTKTNQALARVVDAEGETQRGRRH